MKDKTRKKLQEKKHRALRKGRLQKEVSSSGIEVASVVSTAQSAVVCTTGKFQDGVESSDKTMRVSVN